MLIHHRITVTRNVLHVPVFDVTRKDHNHISLDSSPSRTLDHSAIAVRDGHVAAATIRSGTVGDV